MHSGQSVESICSTFWARFAVKVVNRMRSVFSGKTLEARCLARCMATTVLPVPAPPVTLAGPLKFLATSFSWLGWRKTRHFSSGASRMAVKSLSDWMVTNRRRVSGCSRAAARSPVSTFSFLGWATTAARISSGGMPSASHVRASAHSAGKCLFTARSSSGVLHGPDGWQQDGREAEGEQQSRPRTGSTSRRSSSCPSWAARPVPPRLTLMICKAPVTGLISKTRFLAQAIASSWLSTQARMYTSPWPGWRTTARYFWSMRTVRTLSSRTSWIFS